MLSLTIGELWIGEFIFLSKTVLICLHRLYSHYAPITTSFPHPPFFYSHTSHTINLVKRVDVYITLVRKTTRKAIKQRDEQNFPLKFSILSNVLCLNVYWLYYDHVDDGDASHDVVIVVIVVGSVSNCSLMLLSFSCYFLGLMTPINLNEIFLCTFHCFGRTKWHKSAKYMYFIDTNTPAHTFSVCVCFD